MSAGLREAGERGWAPQRPSVDRGAGPLEQGRAAVHVDDPLATHAGAREGDRSRRGCGGRRAAPRPCDWPRRWSSGQGGRRHAALRMLAPSLAALRGSSRKRLLEEDGAGDIDDRASDADLGGPRRIEHDLHSQLRPRRRRSLRLRCRRQRPPAHRRSSAGRGRGGRREGTRATASTASQARRVNIRALRRSDAGDLHERAPLRRLKLQLACARSRRVVRELGPGERVTSRLPRAPVAAGPRRRMPLRVRRACPSGASPGRTRSPRPARAAARRAARARLRTRDTARGGAGATARSRGGGPWALSGTAGKDQSRSGECGCSATA